MRGDVSHKCLAIKITTTDSQQSLKYPRGKFKNLKIEKTDVIAEIVAAQVFILWIVDKNCYEKTRLSIRKGTRGFLHDQ